MPFIPVAVLKPSTGPSPDQLPPVTGYAGWWDASQTDSLVFGQGQLAGWLDLSGNGYHLGRDVVAPLYGARTINGVIVPDFTGGILNGSAPRDDRTSCTFVVAEVDSIAAGVRTMIGSNGTGGLHFRTQTDDLQTSTSAVVMAQLDNVIAANVPFVAVQNVTATDVTQHLTGSSETDANATALTAGRTMTVGYNVVNTELWDGAIAEIIYYPVTLAGGDVTTMISWLQAKWGI